jgi:hypothetical protein
MIHILFPGIDRVFFPGTIPDERFGQTAFTGQKKRKSPSGSLNGKTF